MDNRLVYRGSYYQPPVRRRDGLRLTTFAVAL